jgi:DNA-binding NarL/FixJ family response regulator
MRIYRSVVAEGWIIANARFPRELSVALRWQDNPLAWTYTTIHTLPSVRAENPLGEEVCAETQYSVALIEPDAGIRSALMVCVNSQQGFDCRAAFGNTEETLKHLGRHRVDLALVNHDLPDEASTTCAEQLQRVRPDLTVLSYSVFSDADQLFKSTPGGAAVYMLKRTGRNRLLEPIAGMVGAATREHIASYVRDYFQNLSALLPSGAPLWKLAKLTPREHEILAFLSKGALAKEIADTLGISNWTVHGHMKSIFEKLNVHTRTEAVIKYLQK